MKISVELPELENGFEYTGEYRKVQKGEYYFHDGSIYYWHSSPTEFPYLIVRKTEPDVQDFIENLANGTVIYFDHHLYMKTKTNIVDHDGNVYEFEQAKTFFAVWMILIFCL